MVRIFSLQKNTLQDFPGHLACIVFLSGCNFRCSFCHNPAAVQATASNVSVDELFSFLIRRKGILEGVVISGGEPTIYGEQLIDLLSGIKALGYAVKLDTNGSNPTLLKKIVDLHLVDYIAMDVKTSLDQYAKLTKTKMAKQLQNKIIASVNLIKESGIDYEFRTTVYPQMTLCDLKDTAKLVKGAKQYFLKKYCPDITLDAQKPLGIYGDETLQWFAADLREKGIPAILRL